MATELKLRRGTTAQHATFTGAAGEVTVDTDKNILVVHDGSTSGGFPVTGGVVGSVALFAFNSAPDGWLKANGAAVSRTIYADLFSAIGTTFGTGDGSTTFNLPDLRGEFIRGWDDGRGIDSGRSFGSFQADELKSHFHGGTYRILSNGGSVGYNQGLNARYDRNTSSTGGSETRPRNIALLACIKY